MYALPSLQLGPGNDGTWTYDHSSQTWIVEENSFELNAYANAIDDNSQYAWGSSLDASQTAYLVAAAVPTTANNTDVFEITVQNDGSALTLASNGYGAPPLTDSNALAPHGVYKTYFEIYQFSFDGSKGTIHDTRPGESGSGSGYTKIFDITINSLADGVDGIHFDLFTMSSDGQVIAFAPFSHDAETAPVPEPATMILLGTGLIGLAGFGRKFLNK